MLGNAGRGEIDWDRRDISDLIVNAVKIIDEREKKRKKEKIGGISWVAQQNTETKSLTTSKKENVK